MQKHSSLFLNVSVAVFAIFMIIYAQDVCELPVVSMPEFQMAIDAKDNGNDSLAIAKMEDLIREFQGSPAPYYILGNWFWERGDQYEAQKMWKKARTASPS